MNPFITLPAGIRLDEWSDLAATKSEPDAPEVAELREEFRKSMPQVASIFDMLAKLRPINELAGRVRAPVPTKVITRRN